MDQGDRVDPWLFEIAAQEVPRYGKHTFRLAAVVSKLVGYAQRDAQ